MPDYEQGTEDVGGVESEGSVGTENQGQEQTRTIPIERFNQVYGKSQEYEKSLNQYKTFGDPGSIQAKMDKLASWEKAVEDQRKQASMTPDDKAAQQRTLQLQKELYQVMPSLKNLEKLEAMQARIDAYEGKYAESQATSTLEKHSRAFTDVLKSAKIDSKFQSKIEEYIVSQMSDDEKRQFIAGDFKVADNIFKRELSEGLFSTFRKPNLPTPAVRNTPGGTPPQGKGKSPMTMKEAEDAAWSRMNGD